MYTPPSARASAAAYRQVGVDSQVLSASPHGLIGLLFNELLVCLQGAATAIERRDVATKVRLMAKASRLIDEGLMSSLDVQAGGEVAANLQQLYAYCLLRLAQANAANDAAQVRDVQALLEPVIDGWRQIGGRA
ncbi:flagellar export chaperone FliS [Comamonas faecalis]|uniref:Flagellar secretion chaperone FliS n=1 Tax=Comamonas faecalis TaxID=1387849 RepID=A0ABP7QHW4_9BURK